MSYPEKMTKNEKYFSFTTPRVVIQSLFSKYDINGNGFLEQDELRALLEQDLGMTPDHAEVFTLLIDKKGDQKVTLDNIVDWLHSGERFLFIKDSSRFHIISKAVELFKIFDKNDNGSLDRKEFTTLVQSLGYKQVNSEKEFATMDNDSNGVISFWEFLSWLNWIPSL